MAMTILETPFGPLFVAATSKGVRRIDFRGPSGSSAHDSNDGAAVLDEAVRQIETYFDGGLRAFDLPLDLGGSDFQRRCWQIIGDIPFGKVATYAEVAATAGAPGAYRAAGAACARNPIAIVVPCHRVVGSDGGLHGFGGGLDTKAWLLRHEGWQVDPHTGRLGKQPALALA